MISKVNILGIDHTIDYIPKCELLEQCAGLVEYAKAEIKISNELVPQQKKRVILHEILHVILNELNITDENLCDICTEDLIKRLTVGLVNVDIIDIKTEGV